MDPLGCKIVCVFGILVIKLIFGLLPCSFHEALKRLAARTPTRRKYFSMSVGCFHCFSAGGLLSISFLHIFPDCQRILGGVTGEDLSRSKFPLAEMLTVMGLYVLLVIDRSIHCVQRSKCRSPATPAQSMESVTSTSGFPTVTSYALTRNPSVTEDEIDMSDIIADNHADLTKPKMTDLSVNEQGVSLPVDLYVPVEHREFQILYTNSGGPNSSKVAIFFAVALCFPGLFSGMALGLQPDPTGVWMLFVGVGLRELVLSFTLGLELVRTTDRRYQSLIGIAGASVFPAAGIIIGTLMESASYYHTSMGSALAVLQCIANGGILYTIFFDILQQEMEDDYRFPAVISSLVGFGAMTMFIGIAL